MNVNSVRTGNFTRSCLHADLYFWTYTHYWDIFITVRNLYLTFWHRSSNKLFQSMLLCLLPSHILHFHCQKTVSKLLIECVYWYYLVLWIVVYPCDSLIASLVMSKPFFFSTSNLWFEVSMNFRNDSHSCLLMSIALHNESIFSQAHTKLMHYLNYW